MAAEGATGTLPQVFVVDRQASYVSMPDGKRAKWATASHTCLLLLLGVALLGLIVEAFFIYNLYQRIEVRLKERESRREKQREIQSGRDGAQPGR